MGGNGVVGCVNDVHIPIRFCAKRVRLDHGSWLLRGYLVYNGCVQAPTIQSSGPKNYQKDIGHLKPHRVSAA
jgi:hypothetical protein